MNARLAFSLLTVIFSLSGALSQDKIPTKIRNTTECSRESDCTFNAYCHLGRCICKNGFLQFRETKKSPIQCLKKAAEIMDYCEKDIQCTAHFGTHSHCKREDPTNVIGKCFCEEDAHFIDGLCYKTARIGDLCDVNDNCVIKSKNLKAFCEYSHCICPPKHYPIDNGADCHPTSELEGPCISSDGCIPLNSECKRGICKCRREYMPNYDNQSCLLVAKRLGDPCDEDGQCLVAHRYTVCNSSTTVCQCQQGAHQMDGTCWKTAKLLERCGDTNECRSDPHRGFGIECSHGICQCREGYQLENSKECVKWEPKQTGTGSMKELSILLLLTVLLMSTRL